MNTPNFARQLKNTIDVLDYIIFCRHSEYLLFRGNHSSVDTTLGMWLAGWPYFFNTETGVRIYLFPENTTEKMQKILFGISSRYISFRMYLSGDAMVCGKSIDCGLVDWNPLMDEENSFPISDRKIITGSQVQYDDQIRATIQELASKFLGSKWYCGVDVDLVRWGTLVVLERFLLKSERVVDRKWDLKLSYGPIDHLLLARVCFCVVVKYLFDYEDTYSLGAFVNDALRDKTIRAQKIGGGRLMQKMKIMETDLVLMLEWTPLPI